MKASFVAFSEDIASQSPIKLLSDGNKSCQNGDRPLGEIKGFLSDTKYRGNFCIQSDVQDGRIGCGRGICHRRESSEPAFDKSSDCLQLDGIGL